MEQSEVLRELAKIGAARRGQISEQWYEAEGKDGRLGVNDLLGFGDLAHTGLVPGTTTPDPSAATP